MPGHKSFRLVLVIPKIYNWCHSAATMGTPSKPGTEPCWSSHNNPLALLPKSELPQQLLSATVS